MLKCKSPTQSPVCASALACMLSTVVLMGGNLFNPPAHVLLWHSRQMWGSRSYCSPPALTLVVPSHTHRISTIHKGAGCTLPEKRPSSYPGDLPILSHTPPHRLTALSSHCHAFLLLLRMPDIPTPCPHTHSPSFRDSAWAHSHPSTVPTQVSSWW